MKNNLENIEYSEVIRSDGTSYAELRKTLKPAYGKVIADIVKAYLVLLLVFALESMLIQSGRLKNLVVLPVSAILVGYTLAYLHLFLHAAAHYELHSSKSINDRLSNLLIGAFFGIHIKKYRKVHWLHHTNLGTTSDSEHSYFNGLSLPFLLKSITGIHTLSVIISRMKTSEKLPAEKTPLNFVLYSLLFHSILLLILFLAGGWPVLITWFAALIIVFPVIATIRQLLEHRDEQAENKINYQLIDHGKVSRLFGKGLIDSSFGAAGFNKHLLHHWDPTISYTRLQEVEDFLASCPETAVIIKESKTSYLKTFIALFKIS